MKVLEVIRQGEIGGGESHLIDLVEGLIQQHIEPVVLAFTSGHMIETLLKRNIKCHVITSGRAFDLRIQKRICNIIRSEPIDIIHAHGSRAASNVIGPAHVTGVPLVYTVHGWSFHQDQNWLTYRLRVLSEKILCHFSQKVICVSHSNHTTGKEEFGLKNCQVIANGVNLLRFDYQLIPQKEIRKELGFSPDDIIVALTARITAQKDPLTFIESIANAHNQDKRIKGLVVGDGDLKPLINQYINDKHWNKFIHTTPFRTDMPEILKAIDIYCLPSLWEGLSISLLEAMAMKKAVVVTPTDGTREIIRNEQNGLLVGFGNRDQLADRIIRLANDKELLRKLGDEAYKLIKEHFNGQHVAIEVAKIYHQLTEKA